MPYDRDSRYDRDSDRDYNQAQSGDYSRNYGSGRDNSYSSAREYQAAGRMGGDRDYGRDRDDYGRGGYGRSSYGQSSYGQSGYGRSDYDRSDYGSRDYGNQRYGQREQFGRGGYDHDRGYDRDRDQVRGRDYGRQPQGYNYEERGFFDRAGDEVRSWFGDEDAERRRDMDQRYQERTGQTGRSRHDDDYHSWRSTQISSLDRDYDEYRRENRSKFEKEFSDWRTNRQTQRQSLGKVQEHQEVVGSDGQHVGTVDKVRGDRIILTKNDKDAGGQHHSIPCSWITSVDDKVTVNKTADEAKQAWRDEEQTGAMFGKDRDDDFSTNRNLNRSFSGTY